MLPSDGSADSRRRSGVDALLPIRSRVSGSGYVPIGRCTGRDGRSFTGARAIAQSRDVPRDSCEGAIGESPAPGLAPRRLAPAGDSEEIAGRRLCIGRLSRLGSGTIARGQRRHRTIGGDGRPVPRAWAGQSGWPCHGCRPPGTISRKAIGKSSASHRGAGRRPNGPSCRAGALAWGRRCCASRRWDEMLRRKEVRKGLAARLLHRRAREKIAALEWPRKLTATRGSGNHRTRMAADVGHRPPPLMAGNIHHRRPPRTVRAEIRPPPPPAASTTTARERKAAVHRLPLGLPPPPPSPHSTTTASAPPPGRMRSGTFEKRPRAPWLPRKMEVT
jgi:hypothetical protein